MVFFCFQLISLEKLETVLLDFLYWELTSKTSSRVATSRRPAGCGEQVIFITDLKVNFISRQKLRFREQTLTLALALAILCSLLCRFIIIIEIQ